MKMDWKEALLAQSKAMGIDPTDVEAESPAEAAPQEEKIQKEPLHIVVEKKGRGGKTATIVEGFTCSENMLKKTAAALKSALGTGGSARGGEILIQGDRRAEVAAWLRNKGYKLKG